MTLTIYHYPQCGTCRKAMKWLEERGHQLHKVHIVDEPPTKDQLKNILKLSGLDQKKLFNTSGQVYKQQQLKDKLPEMSEEEKWDLLASNGKLIKRPLVTDGQQATIGFNEATFEEVWGQS